MCVEPKLGSTGGRMFGVEEFVATRWPAVMQVPAVPHLEAVGPE